MEISQTQKYILLIAMIVAGAANTIVYKFQNSFFVSVDGSQYPYAFQHPFMQNLTMFIGEGSMIFIFLYIKFGQKDKYHAECMEAETKGLSLSRKKYLWLLVPASCDFITSNLQYLALTMLAPSIYQMLRGGVVLVTALFSVVFLKKKLQKFHYIGCALVFLGVAIVGMANFVLPPNEGGASNDASKQIAGTVLILVSLFFNGFLFVSEEKLFKVFHILPFEMVGTEGGWGILLNAIILPILSTTTCPSSFGSTCVIFPYQPWTTHFESPKLFFLQLGNSGLLIFLVILGICTIAVFNVCGVNVTKHISALARSIADVSRTLLVWIVSLIVTFSIGSKVSKTIPVNPDLKTQTVNPYEWENTRGGAIAIEFVGFIVLVLGNFVYNEIIILPFARPIKEEEHGEQNAKLIQEKDLSMANYNQFTGETTPIDSNYDYKAKGETKNNGYY